MGFNNLKERNIKLYAKKIDEAAWKYICDNSNEPTYEELEKTFKDCSIPPKKDMYDDIIERIKTMRLE